MTRRLAGILALAVACRAPAGHPTAPLGAGHAAGKPTPVACDTGSAGAQRAVYERVTGLPWQDSYPQTCLEASTTFPGLLVMGRHGEGGCDGPTDRASAAPDPWTGAIYDCAFTPDPASVAAVAMARAGWATATPDARGALAWAWLAEVDQLFPIDHDLGDFDPDHPFTAPTVTPAADGGLVATFWAGTDQAWSRRPHVQWSVAFSPAGVPATPAVLDQSSRPRETP